MPLERTFAASAFSLFFERLISVMLVLDLSAFATGLMKSGLSDEYGLFPLKSTRANAPLAWMSRVSRMSRMSKVAYVKINRH